MQIWMKFKRANSFLMLNLYYFYFYRILDTNTLANFKYSACAYY